MPLLLIFIIVPMIELAVLIQVGSYIGVLWTLALIFITAIIGVRLLKLQGVSTLLRAQQRLAEGSLPAKELAEGFLLALAGALLLTPGFLTDGFGFALLMPGVRGHLAGSVMKMMTLKSATMAGGFSQSGPQTQRPDDVRQPHEIHPNPGPKNVIDGEFRRED
ncbi:FxsA family protein [Bacterioplanoides pacificum]|uniref:FxsA family protein n=1 Tax=Bacterioplanoides pacificum TaxID=1171596 RepID=A0ABV7VQI1_9GAMM